MCYVFCLHYFQNLKENIQQVFSILHTEYDTIVLEIKFPFQKYVRFEKKKFLLYFFFGYKFKYFQKKKKISPFFI